MFALLGFIMALVQGGYIRRKMAGKEKKLAIKVTSFCITENFQKHLLPLFLWFVAPKLRFSAQMILITITLLSYQVNGSAFLNF